MRRSRFHPSVLSSDAKFLILLSLLSIVVGFLFGLVFYELGWAFVPVLTIFSLVAVLCYLCAGSIGLIRRSNRDKQPTVTS